MPTDILEFSSCYIFRKGICKQVGDKNVIEIKKTVTCESVFVLLDSQLFVR